MVPAISFAWTPRLRVSPVGCKQCNLCIEAADVSDVPNLLGRIPLLPFSACLMLETCLVVASE